MEEGRPLSRRFKIGIALIIGSMLCGYAALAVVGGGAGTGNPGLRNLGFWVWVLTWIPFLLGLALSGKEGYHYAKRFISERILRRPK